MVQLILFKGWPDPWHKTEASGFNKAGFVTNAGIVIYPRRSRIARTSLERISRKRHQLIDLSTQPHAAAIETFLTSNVINNTLYLTGLHLIGDPLSPLWQHPIRIPILTPISPEERESRWQELIPQLEVGDGIFTVDTRSCGSRLIAYLDQGTWSHTATYSGDGNIIEATTGGVVERNIDAYRDPRYRIGAYRLPNATPAQIERQIGFLRSQVGKRYSFRKAIRLGIRLAFGIWPTPAARDTSPNGLVTAYELIGIV
jgi:YD repeat-containing protein